MILHGLIIYALYINMWNAAIRLVCCPDVCYLNIHYLIQPKFDSAQIYLLIETNVILHPEPRFTQVETQLQKSI